MAIDYGTPLWGPILGATPEPILVSVGSKSHRSRSSRCTEECRARRARSRREFSQRCWSALLSLARIAGLTCPYTARIPGSSWPSRSDLSTSAIWSSSIHVLRPCRRPWGVSLRLTGSHEARMMSSPGGCPEPGQRPPPALCATTAPSSRLGHARRQFAHRPVRSSLIRRVTPRPDGGVNTLPGSAASHGASGTPGGSPPASTRTGFAGRFLRAGYQPMPCRKA